MPEVHQHQHEHYPLTPSAAYTPFVIKAYHMVGSDEWPREDLAAAVDEITLVGELLPAVYRLDQEEMEAECFSGKNRGSTIRQKWPKATPKALEALEEMAREKIEELPRSGLSRSLFNCADLIAGDLEVIFLSVGDWYSVPNGFVFDARELMEGGACFRPSDLLGEYTRALDIVVRQKYRSVARAREEILAMIDLVKGEMQSCGPSAVKVLEACMKGGGICAGKSSTGFEIVWPGPLSLDLAIEVWKNGKRVSK